MNFVNSWKAPNKQFDKWHIVLRASAFTILEIYYDHSEKEFKIMLMNLGFRFKK